VRVATTLAVLLVLAAAGCGGGGKTAATTTVTIATVTNPAGTGSVTTHGRYHYPPALITSYMQSCTTGAAVRKEYCACTLDKLSNNVSVHDFVRVGLAGGKLSKRIQGLINKAAKDCASKL